MTKTRRHMLASIAFTKRARGCFALSVAMVVAACGLISESTLKEAQESYRLGNFAAAKQLLPANDELTSKAEMLFAIDVNIAVNQADTANYWYKKALATGASKAEMAPLWPEIAVRIGQAKQAITQAEALGPKHAALAHHVKGQAARDANDILLALSEFERARALRPSHPIYELDYVDALSQVGKYEESTKLAERVTQLYPHNARAWLSLAWLYQRANRREPALLAYDKALTTLPDHPDLMLGKASLLIELKRFAAAKLLLNNVRAIDPSNTSVLFNLAKVEGGLGNFQRALEIVQENGLTSAFSDDPELHVMLGDAFQDRGLHFSAIVELEKARSLRPDLPQYWVRLIDAHIKADDIYSARQIFNKSPAQFHAAPAMQALAKTLVSAPPEINTAATIR